MAGMFDDLVPAGEKPKAEKVDSGPWDSFKAQTDLGGSDAASSGPWSKYQQGGAFDDLIPAAKPKRNLFAKANDTVIEAGNAAAGLVKAGVDLVAPDSSASKSIGDFIQSGQEKQSDWKKAQRQQMQTDLSNASGELDKAGVYARHALVEDPLGTLGQIAGNIGPFGVAGKAMQGLSAVQKTAATMGLSGGLTAGEVRGNIYDKISNTPDADLISSSPEYAQLRESGVSEQDAKSRVGASISKNLPEVAAAGAIGALGGKFGLEGILTGAGKNFGRLGNAAVGVIDEGSQGAVEQLASNIGVKRVIQNQSLGEDVAMNAVAEGIVGLGGAAVGKNKAATPSADQKDEAPASQLPPPTYTGVPSERVMEDDVERANAVAEAEARNSALWAERDAFEQQRAPQKLPVTGPLSAAVNVGIDAGAINSPANPRYDVPAQPRGSFSAQAELADLINQERTDLADRRELAQFVGQERSDQAQRISEAAGSRRAMDDALADVDQRVAGAATQEAEAARLRLLNNILSGISDTGNPARQFGNALRRAGYRDTGFTEREQQTIQRFTDARAALNSPEATTIPAAPNELDPAAMGIRELSVGQQQDNAAPRDKATEVADLVAQGWRLSVGRTLVSTKGKRRNLNAAEFAAAKEARARINNAMEVGNAAATQMDAVRDQGRRDVGGRGAGNAQPVPGVERGRGADAGASASGMRAPGVVGNAAGAGGALNAAQPEQMAQETPQADGAQAAPAGGRVAARSQAPIMRRDDLIGAIMRVTGGAGIASNMAQTITGDKAGRGNPSLRGLFQNAGTMDLDDTADLLRTQEGYDIRDGNHLAELIREQGAGNRVVSMERAERDAADNAEKEYRAAVNEQAASMGLKRASGKRSLQMVEADIARIEAEIEAKERELSEMEAREERAAIQAEAVYDEIYGADLSESDWMAWLSSRIAGAHTQEEIDNVERIQADREDARAAADADDVAGVESQAGAQSRQGVGADEAQFGGTEERARGASEGFGLTQQTNEQAAEQFAQQQAGEDAGPTKAQADRERDAVPFSLGMQSQPRPQGLQAGLFTADGRVSVAATEESKAEAASAAVVRAKPVSQWSAEEIQARLDRGNLSQESEQKLRDLLASKQKAKPAPAKKKTAISVGHTPGNAQPVTIRNGIVFIGEEPAIDFETGDDVTVSGAATPQHIADALKKSGALGRRKIFGATAIPQMAKANFSESRAAMPADAEFQATERAYGGRESYGRAKADGRTKLNYRQWVQVRTPKFKEWFGDWEAAKENESFNAILKQVENGAIKSGTIIQLGTAGSILNQFGIPSLKIEMTQSVLSQHMKKHGIGFDHLRDLAAHVQAPIAVFKSKRSADSVILLTEIQHPDGDLVVALQANKERNRLVINDIRSIHPKPSQKIDFWIDDGLLIGVDESRGRHLLSTTDRSNSGRGERQEAPDVILFNTDALRNVSKVVDPETGEPLVAYHGTKGDFNEFSPKKKRNEFGVFFSPDPAIASAYSGYDENFPSPTIGSVMPVFLGLKNPLVVDFEGSKEGRGDAIKQALDGGYDGAIFLNHYDAGGVQTQYVALGPTQIKSATGNNGNFDGGNPDILESRADRSAIDTALRRMDRFVAEFERGTMKDSDTQLLGDTPTVLQFLGADNLPLQIDGATVRKVLAGKHRYDVSPQALRNVVQALYDPLAVFRSATGTGLVVLSEVQSNNGNPVVAAIHLAKRKGGMIINDVASIHEKTDAEKSIGAWLRDDLLRYVRNENDLSGAATRHLLPASVATSMKGHMDNVATENDVVNEFGPRYSVASGAAVADGMPLNNRQKMALNVVQRAADKFRAEYAGAAALDIRVVYSRDEIPTRYRPSPYAEGVYHDREGIIYLVAANLPTQQRAWQVLMHESVGHYGLASMMGDKFAGLQATVLKMATAGQDMDRDPQPGERGYETVEAVRRLYPEASDAEVAQEVLARMAETMPDVGWFRMVLNRIAAWLKSAARAFGLASEPTMADVRRTVELAGYHVRSGANLERAPAGQDVAFASQRRGVQSNIAGMPNDTTASGQQNAPAPEADIGEAADGYTRLFSGSHERIESIRDGGIFGGIFASQSQDAADSHGIGSGRVTHYMDIADDKIASSSDLDTEGTEAIIRGELRDLSEEEYDEIFRAIVKDKGLYSADIPEDRILEIFRASDMAEADWDAQRVRGVLAKKLGFQAVEMADEHGTSYLVLPGVKVQAVKNEPTASAGSDAMESRAAVIDRVGSVADRARDIGRRLAGKDAGETAAMFPDLDADQQAFLGKIGGGKTKAADAIRAAFDRAGLKIRHGLVDRYAALKELDEKAVGEDFINTAITDSSWVLAKMSSAGAGALNAMMTTGRIAFDAAQRVITLRGEPNGGLVDVLRQLGGPAEVERWFGWVAANRAEKLMAEGREHLFTADEIAAGKRMNLGKTDDGKARPVLYAKVFSEFNQFRDDVVAIAEQTGVLSAEERAMWKDEFYVPFYRVMQEDGDAKGLRASKGLSRQEAYKKLKGGRENLNDLMENTLMNFHHLLSASLKNQAATQAIRNAEKAGIARRVPESRRDTKTSTFILEGGDRVFYEVDDTMVYEAITSLSDPGLNNFAVRMMSAFKRVFTNMTTVTPQFVIANTFRDLLQAAATSPTSKNIFRTAMQGAASYRDQKTRAEMLAAGGAFSFGHIYGTDTDEIKASLRKNVAGANLISDPSMVPEILRQGWKRWNEITDTSENITRAAAYVQNVEQLGKLRAAFEARDIMDFSQHGAWPAVRFMIRVVPFLNARLQGLDKLYRSGAKPMLLTAMGEGTASDKQAAARFASVTGALVLASLALYMANADDDEYQKLEEWQKDTYWFFRIGENAFFLPKPFEVGAISTMAERVAQQMMDDKATGKLFRERLGDMLMQTFAFNPTPQLFQPMIDVYSNKDAFTGRDIETMGMERLSKGLRARDTTTAAAQAVSSASRVFGDETPFAVSPVQADHLIRGYLGTVGAQAAGMIDTIWRTAAGQEAPSKAWSEYQPIKRFYRDLGVPSSHNRYSTLFYDGLREANRVYADVMELQKLGRQDDARELSAENRGLLSMRQALNRDQRSLSEINKRIQDARRSDMDGDQKRQEIDRLTVMKNAITDRSGRLVESIRAAE